MENVSEKHIKCQKMSDRTFAFSAHDLSRDVSEDQKSRDK